MIFPATFSRSIGQIQIDDTMVDDRTLIERVLSGDATAFGVFVEQYQKLVSHIVFRMVPDASDREDICQEVFMKAYRALSGFQFEAKVSTWLGRIAYNTSVNYLAKSKPIPISSLGGDEIDIDDFEGNAVQPDDKAEAGNISSILRCEIAKLPPAYRAVVTLYHLDEMTYTEISDILDLPINTVKSHLFRARKKLKSSLETSYNPEDLCH